MKLKLALVGITFKLQGQTYHSSESLAPPENSTAKLTQIYFVGDDIVLFSVHQTVIQGLRQHTVDQLQHMMLHQSNSYTQSLRMAVDILSRHSQEFKVIINANKRPFHKLILIFTKTIDATYLQHLTVIY